MNISQLLGMVQMMNGNGKVPSKEEVEKKVKNMTPEEKEKVNAIFNSAEVQEAIKTNNISKIISAIQANSKKK